MFLTLSWSNAWLHVFFCKILIQKVVFYSLRKDFLTWKMVEIFCNFLLSMLLGICFFYFISTYAKTYHLAICHTKNDQSSLTKEMPVNCREGGACLGTFSNCNPFFFILLSHAKKCCSGVYFIYNLKIWCMLYILK